MNPNKQEWDIIVVGGGHNGLTAAAYLARAGKQVLVLEKRDQVGGACTIETPFVDEAYKVSPCAYMVGLLDDLVVQELELVKHGYHVFPADPNTWCPFPDGTSFASFIDSQKTVAHMRENNFSEIDIKGLLDYEAVFNRIRLALRKGSLGDTWLGSSPSREEIEVALEGDPEMISIVFEESIVDTLERYVQDPRLKHALFGQGIIGAYAGPYDPGTASVKLMHHQGDLLGLGPVWGYVRGGMGQVSFAIAKAAESFGATILTGQNVVRIVPSVGVELDSGVLIASKNVISNTDPKRTLSMLDSAVIPEDFSARIKAWQTRSPVVKLNAGLHKLPTFIANDGANAHKAMVAVTPGLDAAAEAFEQCKLGIPQIGFADVYFQTAYDPSVAPKGKHTMSVFAQYAPYELAEGTWDSRRDEIGKMVLDTITAYAPDVHDCIEYCEVLGPPDVEQRIGLTGGNIFQGEVMPNQMWGHRFDHKTPVEGLYLCGAATHPAGSVIAINGRNAAKAVLADIND